MRHLTWILKNQLATRPGPRGAPWDLEELKKNAGIRAILSVSDEGEVDDVKKAGMRHFRFYVDDIPLMTVEAQRNFLLQVQNAPDIIQQEISAGNPVLVHCYAGRDRSGFVVAAYLVKYADHSAENALKAIRRLKEYCVFPGYDEALERYEQELRSSL